MYLWSHTHTHKYRMKSRVKIAPSTTKNVFYTYVPRIYYKIRYCALDTVDTSETNRLNQGRAYMTRYIKVYKCYFKFNTT